MPRPVLVDRPVEKKLSIRSSITEQIDQQLADPLTGKPAYGAWATLVESLLREWLAGKVDISIKPKLIDLEDFL